MFLSWFAAVGSAQGPQSDTPGFAFLGSGYDLLQGNPLATDGLGDPGFRHEIFNWKYTEGLRTSDNTYRIADKSESRTFSDCSTAMDSQVYNSAYSYKKLINNAFSINAGIPTPGGGNVNFDLSADVRNTKNHTDNKSRLYAHVSATCTRYQLQMNAFDQAELTTDFARGVSKLPLDYNEEIYAKFLKVFGTHYVSAMKVGGRWGMQMEFTSDNYQALIDNYFNVGFGVKAVAGGVNGGFHASTEQDRKTTYAISNAISKNSTFSIGGDFSADSTTWIKSVTKTPMPVHMTLDRLDDLFDAFALPKEDASGLAKKKANIAQAIGSWCKYHEKMEPGFDCTPQKPIPMPTPSPIGDDAIRRVCVENRGAFRVWWHIVKDDGTVGAQTGGYRAGVTRCLDGTDFGAKRGDTIGCSVNIQAHRGGPINCDTPWKQFNEDSTMQANYKCTGVVTNPHCVFDGVSRIGTSLASRLE